MKYEKVAEVFRGRCQKEIKEILKSKDARFKKTYGNGRLREVLAKLDITEIINDIIQEQELELDKIQQEELLEELRPVLEQLLYEFNIVKKP